MSRSFTILTMFDFDRLYKAAACKILHRADEPYSAFIAMIAKNGQAALTWSCRQIEHAG